MSPMKRHLYPKNWTEISISIRRDRAKNRCECMGECGLHLGYRCEERNNRPALHAKGRIVLTVAHLDHEPMNCDPENLRAMCQRCHLRYDRELHAENRSRTFDDRRGQGRLWGDHP